MPKGTFKGRTNILNCYKGCPKKGVPASLTSFLLKNDGLEVVLKEKFCYPNFMLSEFVSKKLREAKYKLLKDGSYFGEIPGLKGVWANAKNLEDCREELREVLEDWLLLKIRDREKVPGLVFRTNRHELVRHV